MSYRIDSAEYVDISTGTIQASVTGPSGVRRTVQCYAWYSRRHRGEVPSLSVDRTRQELVRVYEDQERADMDLYRQREELSKVNGVDL